MRPARRTNAHQNGNGEIRSNRCVEEVEERGTGRAGGRQWLTMRHAIGPRAPTGGVARLGVVHQYPVQPFRSCLQWPCQVQLARAAGMKLSSTIGRLFNCPPR